MPSCYIPHKLNENELKNVPLVNPSLVDINKLQSDMNTELIKAKSQVNIAPFSFSNHVHYADLLWTKGNLNKAKNQYEIALSLNPSYSYSYFMLAQISIRKEEYGEAINTLNHYLILEPDNPHAHAILSSLFAKCGKEELAMAECKKTINILNILKSDAFTDISNYQFGGNKNLQNQICNDCEKFIDNNRKYAANTKACQSSSSDLFGSNTSGIKSRRKIDGMGDLKWGISEGNVLRKFKDKECSKLIGSIPHLSKTRFYLDSILRVSGV